MATELRLAHAIKRVYEEMPLGLSRPDGYLALRWLVPEARKRSLPRDYNLNQIADATRVSIVVLNTLAGRITRQLAQWPGHVTAEVMIEAMERVIDEITHENRNRI